MAYPPQLTRLANYTRNQLNDQDLDVPAVDSEFNQLVSNVNTINARVRGITTADGRLTNLASATAEALAGVERFSATSAQTTFDTAIPWDATFTELNVFVYADGVLIDSSLVTASDNSDDLRVVIPAQDTGTVVFVAAYTAGAGVITNLASTDVSKGASLVAIHDSGGLFATTNVEAALAEVMTQLNTLTANIGTIGNYVKKDGSVAMTGALAMGTHKITGGSAATNPTDFVIYSQLTAYTNIWDNLSANFLSRAGGTLTGALAMSAQKITGLAAGTVAGDAVRYEQLVGAYLPLAGGTMTGAIAMGGTLKITGLGAATTNGDAVRYEQWTNTDGAYITSGSIPAARMTVMVGDSGAGGVKGAVPAPSTGDAAARKFLKADGTWAAPSGAVGTGYIILRHKLAATSAGTTSTALTSGSWQTRTINTEFVDSGNHCSLAANRFTLLAGTYRLRVRAQTVFYNTVAGADDIDSHSFKFRLQNITDATTVDYGAAYYAANDAAVGQVGQTGNIVRYGELCTRITILASKDFELQEYPTFSGSNIACAMGVSHGQGDEIYAEIEIVRE